ncbi:MAG TPA: hypothetical protein VGF48_26175 [Thermoanaerobaculia bacterium]|jgi:3-oxoacyl-ACP reductase-like protein
MNIYQPNKTLPGLARGHTAAACLFLRKSELEDAIEHAEIGEKYARQLGDCFSLAKSDWAWARISTIVLSNGDTVAKSERAVVRIVELDPEADVPVLQHVVRIAGHVELVLVSRNRGSSRSCRNKPG